MFYSSVVRLPNFGANDESEMENMVKELMEENGGEGFQEGGINQDLVNQPPAKMSVNGEVVDENKKRKKCAC